MSHSNDLTPDAQNPAAPQRSSRRRERSQRPDQPGFRQRLHDIIFEADSRAGRWFDIALLLAILSSIVLVAAETLPEYTLDAAPTAEAQASPEYQQKLSVLRRFMAAEWVLTILFTIEYGLRLYCSKHPLRYAFSFWGIIDLLSILPSYATLLPLGVNSRSFVILRSIRLLRVFRVLKLWRMMSEADELSAAVWKSREKIIVFLVVVLVAVTISGSLMYFIETELQADPSTSDFTSIPQAMYWAIVTMTTVGYGDVVPHTAAGKVISAALILLGYSLIIVPTGFVSAELSGMAKGKEPEREYHPCPTCGADRHRVEAKFCFRCGGNLDEPSESSL